MLTIKKLFSKNKNPLIMGILNVTPDSFSDGGKNFDLEDAVKWAFSMVDAGADIIDIGGESTRPGSTPISVEEEIKRVEPVIKELRKNNQLYLSLDTNKPEVMELGINLGVNMINDVRALQNNGSLDIFLKSKCDICLMHMLGLPSTMQNNPVYRDIASEVLFFLEKRVNILLKNGVSSERIIIDPGFGFGKTHEDNLLLFQNIKKFSQLNLGLMVGISRKSMIKNIVGSNENDIIHASSILAAVAAKRGANILRVHDVHETKKVIDFLN